MHLNPLTRTVYSHTLGERIHLNPVKLLLGMSATQHEKSFEYQPPRGYMEVNVQHFIL